MAEHQSIADRLSAAGVDVEALRTTEPCTAAVVPILAERTGGSVVGLLFEAACCRPEEEVGVGDLRKALTGPDNRAVQLSESGRNHVARFADVNGFVLSTRPVSRTLTWGDDVRTAQRAVDVYGQPRPADWREPYVRNYSNALPYLRRDRFAQAVQYGEVPMSDLRAKARGLGLTNLPRTKASLASFVLSSEQYAASALLEDVWPAWFAHGKDLVVRADSGVVATIVDALGEAIEAGTLAVTSHSSSFSSGLLIFDGRDETQEIREARAAACDWYDARMADLAAVEEQLKEWGHGWYFLGHPQEMTDNDGSTVVRYWLNGLGAATSRGGLQCRRQPFGWYSLQELREEKFVADAVEREAAVTGARR